MVSVYEMISERFIDELKKGIIPWQKPWTGVREGAYSRSTGRPYSLINQLLLGKPGEYLTFKQVQEAGGKVKKGEKSSFVVFWKPLPVKETTKDGKEVTKVIPCTTLTPSKKRSGCLRNTHSANISQSLTRRETAPIIPLCSMKSICRFVNSS